MSATTTMKPSSSGSAPILADCSTSERLSAMIVPMFV